MNADSNNPKVNSQHPAASSADGDSGSAKPAQTSAGNFLRNNQSLVMRSARSDRFTEKFRDGMVQRILNGTTTIAEVREQHHLTEQDVIDWMKHSFDRKQKRIDRLVEILRKTQTNDEDFILKVKSEPRQVEIKGDVIDGKSQTKQP
jgi:transposase-like protein